MFVYEPDEFWAEIQVKLAYLHGRPRLSDMRASSQAEDALRFLHECDDVHFLDFVEYIFDTQAYFRASARADLVRDINEFLRQDDLPYALTDFVWTSWTDDDGRSSSRLTSRPQVIRKDSDVVFATAVRPALEFLRDSRFVVANGEFLSALEDFRREDYGDCLVKCGSSFESTLKIICAHKRWPTQGDTALPLLKTVIANSGLEAFFEQPLIVVATLRNKLSTAHGGGQSARAVSSARAEYTINATAAAILLLLSASGMRS